MNDGRDIRTWCVASTTAERKELDNEQRRSDEDEQGRGGSCILDSQLSPDGTCIITSDYARKFSVYAFNSDVSKGNNQHLAPYAQLASADPIWGFAVNPQFDLNYRETTTVLVSRRDQYIGLHNALWDTSRDTTQEDQPPPPKGPVDISAKLASYKFVDKLTEAVTAPMSLVWSPDGAYFYAGQKNKIGIFDLTYTDDPITTIRTIPSDRNKLKGGGWGFKGDISALSHSPPTSTINAQVLAAGTRTRCVGLYSVTSAKEITHFALPGMINGQRTDNPNLQDIIGQGITQLKWSPDGQYLYVAERSSDVVLVYDVRNFQLALGHCAGRKALTRHKMDFDLWQMDDGSGTHEIWAGGTDGKARVWRNPYLREGAVEADEVIDMGEDPVSSVLVHPYGHAAVVAKGVTELGSETNGKGVKRGGVTAPAFREWGCLEIFGLGSY